mgnify:CR=1 FL=1
MEKAFRTETIDGFLDALGSTAPAPGGGAAAGLLGAQACALAEKVCALTLTNKKYAEIHEQVEAWQPIFREARSIMLDLMDEDAAHFEALMAAYRQPKPADEAGRAARTEAIQQALEKSAQAPAQIAQTMADMMPLFTKVLQQGNVNLITDSIIAAQCAMAAVHAAILNVRINLKSIKNEFYVREMEDTIRSWEDACSAIDAVLTYQVTL